MASSEAVVHVIDDDEAIRESLAFLLQSADLGVHTYETANKFLESVTHSTQGCIVTDIRMPGLSGVELLRRLRTMGVGLPVIVITGHADVPLAVEAMKSGAVDFMEKPFDDDAFVSTVRAAMRQHEKDARRHAELTEIHARLAALSGRERQVLDGLVAGCPNKTIAFDLGISARTVEIYRANVMTKMQAASLSDLVRMALVAGVLSPGGDPPRR